jgi:hypothetical protein
MTPLEERVPIGEVTDLIRLGVALPFRVLDSLERLLLNEGQTIGSDRQMELLMERGAWVDRKLVEEQRARLGAAGAAPMINVKRITSLFDRWERALWDLDAVLRGTAKGATSHLDWNGLTSDLIALIDRDVDVALYLAVRQEDRRFALYPLAHSLHCAVLGLLAARNAGWTPERQHSVVGAALSMNVAMLELQALMAEQDTPPTQKQLDQIRSHPLQGVQMLRQAGLTDMAWLRAVAEHHERADGAGYPRAVTEVSDEARVLRMADVYMAKITPRAKRPPLPPLMASRQLFQSEPGSALAMALIKAIGVHPPGCLVQLKSGEVAVVKRRGAAGPAPVVCTLSDKQGKPSIASQTLDSADAAHAIAGPYTETARYARVQPERVYGVIEA